MRRIRVVVSGRVQGVFFRDSCRRRAERANVAGWVRNRDDGTVEAVFEGPEDAVTAMVDWCRQGPSTAHVQSVATFHESPAGLGEFAVRS